jgi:hypothetical protein
MLGLGSLFGRVGLSVVALLALLLGNPLSGLNSAPEMLPTGWALAGATLIVIAAVRQGRSAPA